MLSLEALQKTIAQSVLGRPYFGVSPLLEGKHYDPYGRLRIYRNNTRASLTSTLMAVFPVTVQLVDERFFRYAASEFVRLLPPAEPRLVRFGADFPNFLRTFEGVSAMPFVAETARLEWAIAEALDASARPALGQSTLQDGGDDTTPDLILQPSLRMIVSHWPILSIWSAHQDGGRFEPMEGNVRRAERLAVWRQDETVRFARLDAAQFAFRYSLKAGHGLEKAALRALSHNPMFDLAGAVTALFNDGLVAHIRFDRNPANDRSFS